MTYLGRFNKLLRQIRQLETNKYYFNLIKKVCLHAPENLAIAIRHTKNYEIAIEKTNHIKLKIDQLTKKIENYFTNQQQQQQLQKYQPPQQQNQNNYSSSNSQNQSCYYCGIPEHWKRDCKKLQRDQQNRTNQLLLTCSIATISTISINSTVLATYLVPQNSGQQRLNHYHIQPNFQQTALFKSKVVAPRLNFFNNTISPAQIAQNASFSDIFSFEFEANKSPFLLSNVAANEQKAITAIYTKAEVEKKFIQLILDSRSAGTDSMKKTPVREIDNFLFTIDGIIIPVKVLIMDVPQYQALETQELKISYQGQYTRVSVTCSTFNKRFEKAPVFKFEEEKKLLITKTFMALGSTSKPWKQLPYIPLKCKDCNKKLSSMGACISPEEKYETCTCYFCKAYYRE
ncbi:hypothetical protein G9A89_022734 [Geosiphon pyriformis]|nr:hypothetical protein G9A89_022734 [Geosiphon pyriformis]